MMSKSDYQSTSDLLLHAREVEDALKRNKNTPLARFGIRGRWRRRKRCQNTIKIHLLLLACEGGGGRMNGIKINPHLARFCMRGGLRKRGRRRNALQVTLHLHAGEVEVRTVSKIHLQHALACEEGGGEHHQNGLRLVLRVREEGGGGAS